MTGVLEPTRLADALRVPADAPARFAVATSATSATSDVPAGATRLPRIGFVNLMPHARQFELMLLPQFGTAGPFEPVWLRMAGRRYALDDPADIDARYVDPADAGPLDGLVVTGAAVEHLPFEQVRYLPELGAVVADAAGAGLPVLGLCWGALAVGHLLLGLRHEVYEQKVSGAYPTDLLVTGHPAGGHPIADGLDDRFWTAHSRYAGFDESTVDDAVRAGRVRRIAAAPGAGTIIAESADHQVLMHIGHPEYPGERLAAEYRRDLAAGLPSLRPPAGVDLDAPRCLWRSHSLAFFAGWTALVARCARARHTAVPPTSNVERK